MELIKRFWNSYKAVIYAAFIFMAILFGSIGNAIGGIEEELTEKPVIGIIDLDNGPLSDNVIQIINDKSEVIFNSSILSDKQYGLEKVKDNDGIALILITHNFSENIINDKIGEIEVYWIMAGAGILDSISSEIVEGIIYSSNYFKVSYID